MKTSTKTTTAARQDAFPANDRLLEEEMRGLGRRARAAASKLALASSAAK
ncbi:MAG: hypothetical protein IRZ04_16990, partial [Rhodospirillales bacterium]|nr:hypothetical protein [Rhodospirillales bacterium]